MITDDRCDQAIIEPIAAQASVITAKLNVFAGEDSFVHHSEACQHARNYGCRLRRYLWDGVEMLSLENRLLKVVFALGKGADIVEFLHKPTDTDVMWHSFNQLKNIKHISTVAAEAGKLPGFLH